MNPYLLTVLAHIVGLTMFAGITVSSFALEHRYWSVYSSDRTKASAIDDLMKKFPIIGGTGMLILLLSGIALVIQSNGAYAKQTWFHIKMSLIVIMVVNGIFMDKNRKKIKPAVADADGGFTPLLRSLKRRQTIFYIIQLTIVFLIFSMGVLKIK